VIHHLRARQPFLADFRNRAGIDWPGRNSPAEDKQRGEERKNEQRTGHGAIVPGGEGAKGAKVPKCQSAKGAKVPECKRARVPECSVICGVNSRKRDDLFCL
jgi:hypothetical protein